MNKEKFFIVITPQSDFLASYCPYVIETFAGETLLMDTIYDAEKLANVINCARNLINGKIEIKSTLKEDPKDKKYKHFSLEGYRKIYY